MAATIGPRRLMSILPLVIIVALVVLVLWATGLAGDILDHWDDIVFLTQQHVELVAISGGLAILAGIPLGIALSRPSFRRAADSAMQVLNVGTTVPTLAVLALSMSFLGIGTLPAIFALWVATLLPIVRNTYVGLLEVPQPLLESATGMGMRPWQILSRVEIPNALLGHVRGNPHRDHHQCRHCPIGFSDRRRRIGTAHLHRDRARRARDHAGRSDPDRNPGNHRRFPDFDHSPRRRVPEAWHPWHE